MNLQGGVGLKRRLSTCEIKQQSWASYVMLSVTCTTLSLPLAQPYSNMSLQAWTSRAARGPPAEDNCNFSTCKSLFDKIIYKTKQSDYHVCVNAHCDIQIQPAFSDGFHSSTVFRAVLILNPRLCGTLQIQPRVEQIV